MKYIVISLILACLPVCQMFSQTADDIIYLGDSLINPVKTIIENGQFNQAIDFLAQNEGAIKELPQEYSGYYDVLLGLAYVKKKEYLRAKVILKTVGKHINYNSFCYQTYLDALTFLCIETNDLIMQEDVLTKTSAFRKSVYGLGTLYLESLNWQKGFYTNFMSNKDALDKSSFEFASAFSKLGFDYMEYGNLDSAFVCLFNAKYICEENNDTLALAISNNGFGVLYMVQGFYNDAEKYLLEAYQVMKNDVNVIQNLGNLYMRKRNYRESEKYFEEARQLFMQYFNFQERIKIIDKHIFSEYLRTSYTDSLNVLNGKLHLTTGKYKYLFLPQTDIIDLFQTSEKNTQDEQDDALMISYGNLLNLLGMVYMELYDYPKAALSFIESLDIRYLTGGFSVDYAVTLANLGMLYYYHYGNELGEKEMARNLLQSAIRIMKNIHHVGDNPAILGLLCNISAIMIQEKDYDSASQTLVDALEIFNQNQNNSFDSNAFETLMINLGRFYMAVEEYDKAENAFLQAKNWEDNVFLGKQKEYSFVDDLINIYIRKNEYTKIMEFLNEDNEIQKRNIFAMFSFLSDYQRATYWAYSESFVKRDYSILAKHNTEGLQILSYNNSLFAKGLLLRSSNEIRDAIFNSGDEQLISQYEKLRLLRQQITQLQSNTAMSDSTYVQSLNMRADSLDKALTIASSIYRDMKTDLETDWHKVQKNLGNNEVAVEFIDFNKYKYNKEIADTTHYAALLLRKDSKSPIFVPLFEKSQLDSLLNDNNPTLDKRIAKLYNGGNPRFYNGQKLYQLVWQPLEKYLSGIETVYYSPSGLLNQISFAAIPADTVLLSDKYDLHLVSSTREVVREKKNKEAFLPVKQAVEYGGIIYDVENPQELQTAARSYKNDSVPMFASRALSEDSTRSGWIYLQGAENEVREIETILQKSKVPNIKYMGVSANEESFKALSGHSPELLHIATHGFFLQDEKEIRQTGFIQMLGNENRSYINPLLRSGLLFAGANRAWKNENIIPDIEDGILTAEEIAQLNLSKTKLVVLSACETALGEVQNSEGVFGLQRAFKLAGVETLVMSLWKVDDDATKDFMITFYQNLMAGETKLQSFKTAQHFVREKYQNPYYWAAFVMMD